MNQKEYIGRGSASNLRLIVQKNSAENLFIVTGKSSYESSGAKNAIEVALKGKHITYFSDFSPNPKIEDVGKGLEFFKQAQCDLVIAVGGGSVIDVAKMINIFSTNSHNPLDYIMKIDRFENKGKPFVAIPTTAGSGSEATHFAVVYVEGKKYSLAHEFILPNYVIVDSNFHMSMPPKLAAVSGMDTMCQAIESYMSVNSTEKSKEYAKESLKLSIKYIEKSVNEVSLEAREKMAKASYLAGKAINISKTTAPHAISYILTSEFGIPHGHAVALTMPHILVFNYGLNETDCNDGRGVEYVKDSIGELVEIFGDKDVISVKGHFIDLMNKIGLKTKLSQLGIKNYQHIINGVNVERLKNNPRKMNLIDIENIIQLA